MQIKTKIIANLSGTVVLSLVLLSVILTNLAVSSSGNSLNEQIEQRLIGLRDGKKQQIEDYFSTINSQVRTLANNLATKSAAQRFISTFHRSSPRFSSASLDTYYHREFAEKFQRQNPDESLDISALLSSLSEKALYFQIQYIADNPHPLGEKDAMTRSPGAHSYHDTHGQYHQLFRQYLQEFGYYDIFIADIETGHVVYSVFKELDFATSLLAGPYADSGLAKAFKGARDLAVGETYITDFEAYLPSYNASASFIASPIFVDETRIGVLIFQMPVDRINKLMTYDGQWVKKGLGLSGETYLVGEDRTLRSQSRFLLEDKPGYIEALKNAGVSQRVIAQISNQGSSIGLQSANSESVSEGLAGRSGIVTVNDYRNVKVASAFAPIDIQGLNWALLAEIDYDEAFADRASLTSGLITTAVATTLVLSVIAVILATYLGKYISAPIVALSTFVTRTAESLDLTGRAPGEAGGQDRDEIGQVTLAFNNLMGVFEGTLNQVQVSSQELAQAVNTLLQKFEDVTSRTGDQESMTIQVSAAIEQMATTSEDMAMNAANTAQGSQQTLLTTETGKNNVDNNLAATEALSTSMDHTMGKMTALVEQSNNIGSVLDVIRGIAEQTNLLALNAAIEAARAGDQGRGFAVVADEVRTLAQRTQDSTNEINQIIASLQHEADTAASGIREAHLMVAETLSQARSAGESLQEINASIAHIQSFNTQLATAATQQSSVSKDMTEQINQIASLAQENGHLLDDANRAVHHVSEQAKNLDDVVAQFKL